MAAGRSIHSSPCSSSGNDGGRKDARRQRDGRHWLLLDALLHHVGAELLRGEEGCVAKEAADYSAARLGEVQVEDVLNDVVPKLRDMRREGLAAGPYNYVGNIM